jgi:uncharacterized protein YwgA
MLSRTEKLSLLLKDLNWLSAETFPKRKVLQKTFYILTEMGIKFDYDYVWYLHGPYSSTLANDIYEIETNRNYYNEQITGYRFKDRPRQIIEKFKKLFKDRKDDPEWLELVASLLFLEKHYEVKENELEELLFDRKPKYENQSTLVKQALTLLPKLS